MADTQGTGGATSTQPSDAQPQVQQQAAPQEPAKTEQPVTEQKAIQTDNKRTQEQFEKLLDSNKKLYEANELLRQELSRRALANQQFAPIQQPPIQQTTASQQVNPADFIEVDPVTGDRYIDDKKLQSKIEDLNTRATRAEQAVQKYIQTSEDREIERQNKEAFGAYPNLNPAGSGFDVTFHNQTRAVIYDSLINPHDYGGKPLSFKDAADFVHKNMNRTTTGESQQASGSEAARSQNAAETNRATEELKQQAAAAPAGETPQMRQAPEGAEELDRLRVQTRLGSTEAIAKRLLNIDHKVKAEENAS